MSGAFGMSAERRSWSCRESRWQVLRITRDGGELLMSWVLARKELELPGLEVKQCEVQMRQLCNHRPRLTGC